MAIALETIGNGNARHDFDPRSITDRFDVRSSEIESIEKRLRAGEPTAAIELLDIADGVTWGDYHNFHYYGDITATIKEIQAVSLLPLIHDDRPIPVIEHIIAKGLAGTTVHEAAIVAARALGAIHDPQVLRTLPLLDRYLAYIQPQLSDDKLTDEFEFSLFPSRIAEALHETRTNLLWRSAGNLRDSIGVVLPFTRRGRGFLVLQPQPDGRNIICWDLEGPLSGQDNAFDTFQLIQGGKEMYQAISYYDDMVCGLVPGHREWRREDYEAGDTLRLILPHLVHHGITEENIRNVSAKATLVPGVKELFDELREEGYNLKIISTSYTQHARSIGRRLGLTEKDINCTALPLDSFRQLHSKTASVLIGKFERQLAGFSPDDFGTAKDLELKGVLDKFYWQDLMETELGQALKGVTVMGGARKAWAVERVARQAGTYLEQIAFVGDSITDAQAAKVVEAVRGLMTAFNGNEYVIPFATIGFASLDMMKLKPVFDAWKGNGRIGVKEWLENYNQPEGEFTARFDWLANAPDEIIKQVIDTHKGYRRKLRESAAAIG